MRRRALLTAGAIVVALALLAWWLWPEPPPPGPPASTTRPEPRSKAGPRRFPFPALADGASDTGERGAPIDPDDPGAGTVVVHVVDEGGQPWLEPVRVASDDCHLGRSTSTGELRFLTAESRCTFEGRIRDGSLARRTDLVSVAVVPTGLVEITLTMPSIRAAGIGVGLARSDEGVRVATVIPGSPAEAAGLESGDLVVAVDGQPLAGRAMGDVVDALIGPEGSTVEVTIGYDGDTGRVDERLVLTREIIELK